MDRAGLLVLLVLEAEGADAVVVVLVDGGEGVEDGRGGAVLAGLHQGFGLPELETVALSWVANAIQVLLPPGGGRA